MSDNCACGCSPEDHTSDLGTVAGGTCANCWHCDYYDTGFYVDPSEGSTEGEREYLANAPRRWFW